MPFDNNFQEILYINRLQVVCPKNELLFRILNLLLLHKQNHQMQNHKYILLRQTEDFQQLFLIDQFFHRYF